MNSIRKKVFQKQYKMKKKVNTYTEPIINNITIRHPERLTIALSSFSNLTIFEEKQ